MASDNKPTLYERLGGDHSIATVVDDFIRPHYGSARLESVLVSFDRGHRWQLAKFQALDSPYAWYQWTTQAKLKLGVYEIWSRAIDALSRSQPLDGTIYWNPNGYE